jgi:hypothetical protein
MLLSSIHLCSSARVVTATVWPRPSDGHLRGAAARCRLDLRISLRPYDRYSKKLETLGVPQI